MANMDISDHLDMVCSYKMNDSHSNDQHLSTMDASLKNPERNFNDPSKNDNFHEMASCMNCNGTFQAEVVLKSKRNTHAIPSQKFHIPSYEVAVYEGSKVKLKLNQESPVVPAIAFHPRHPDVLTVSSYPLDGSGISLKTYNVTSGKVIWSRNFRGIEADWDAIVNMCYNKNGSRLVICIKEETNNSLEYLTRFFVVDMSRLTEIHRTKPSLLRICHPECVLNAKPKVSRCGGYITMPSMSINIIERLPEEESLKEIARKGVLQNLTTQVECAVETLEIPRHLIEYLTFK